MGFLGGLLLTILIYSGVSGHFLRDNNVARNLGGSTTNVVGDEELARIINAVVQAVEPVVQQAVENGLIQATKNIKEDTRDQLNELKDALKELKENDIMKIRGHLVCLDGIANSHVEKVEQNLSPAREVSKCGEAFRKITESSVNRAISSCADEQKRTSEVLTSLATDLNYVKNSADVIMEAIRISADSMVSSSKQAAAALADRLDLISRECVKKDYIDEHIKAIPEIVSRRADKKCQYPFIIMGGGCYHFSGESRMSWHDGLSYCRSLGGHLLIVETPEENTLIRDYLRASKVQPRSFIGGSDRGQEGSWYWLKPSRPIQWSGWASREPSNSGKQEHCLELYGKLDFQWNDDRCEHQFSVICEMPQG